MDGAEKVACCCVVARCDGAVLLETSKEVFDQVEGLSAAAFPRAWLSLFNSEPAMIEAGTLYLQTVGPLYGFFRAGLVLYFASQGAALVVYGVLISAAIAAIAASAWFGRVGWPCQTSVLLRRFQLI